MGLALSVGILAELTEDEKGYNYYSKTFEAVNKTLANNNLPTYNEPTHISEESCSSDMYGYSGLHYLRRIAAYLWTGKPIPSPGKDSPEKDPLLEKYYSSLGEDTGEVINPEEMKRFDHLLFHSDCEGVIMKKLFFLSLLLIMIFIYPNIYKPLNNSDGRSKITNQVYASEKYKTTNTNLNWKIINSADFDWNQDGKTDKIIMELPKGWQCPGTYTKVRIKISGKPDFVLENQDGWNPYRDNEFDKQMYQDIYNKSIIKSDYFALLPISTIESKGSMLLLFGVPYGSSPPELSIFILDKDDSLRLIFKRNFDAIKFIDLDNDNCPEIIGWGWMYQFFDSDHLITQYHPYLVYSFRKVNGHYKAILNLNLSEKYNNESGYCWAGPDFRKDLVVVHSKDGNKPNLVKLDEARKLYNIQ